MIGAHDVTVGKFWGIGVEAGIYLGETLICPAEKTRYMAPESNPTWGQLLEFNIKLKDLPRNAKLCLSLHGVWANPSKLVGGWVAGL